MLLNSKYLRMLFYASFIFIFSNTVSAHCDSMEGPVVKASQKALETGNINYVLVWVKAGDEKEIKSLFDKVLRVRKAGGEAKELAVMYFFETVVRLHRMGEGEGYTGLKPIGYKPEKGIAEADIAIEKKSVKNILAHLDKKDHSKVNELFNLVQAKTDYNVNDVKAGREYVEAYVHFIHFIEELYGTNDNGKKGHNKH
ncbi:MAG: DUF6448 family protein [Ignavibacteriales bacterium]|nr:DUF6448 family protein [Ignavibacteriales bacterium]